LGAVTGINDLSNFKFIGCADSAWRGQKPIHRGHPLDNNASYNDKVVVVANCNTFGNKKIKDKKKELVLFSHFE
jgi:hypothetical protein